MKTIIATLSIFFSFITVSAQTTIFSENMGAPSGTTTITGNTFQNSGMLVYSNGAQSLSADVRITSASSSYSAASAGGNTYFTSTSGSHGFSIENINAANYNTLSIQFGYKKESASSHATFSVDYWNGSSWTTLANSASALFNEAANASAVWYLSKNISLPIDAQINNLKIRFVKSGSIAIRIDDVKLKGFEVLPSVTNSVAGNISSLSATFGGEVTATGGSNIIETGTVYSLTSTNSNPLIGGIGVIKLTSTNPNAGIGTFSNTSGITLLPNVQYSYNAYAIKSTGGAGYGTKSTFYTLAAIPSAPIVNNPSATSLKVAIANDSNSDSTTYAIFETSTNFYVQADGSLGAAAVYQTTANWGIKTVTGLIPSTTYSFQAIAKNGENIVTVSGASTSNSTLAIPTIATSGTLSALSTTYGTASPFTSFTLSGSNLTDNVTISAPTGFEISVTANGTSGYANIQTLSPTSGSINSTTIYVRLAAIAPFGTYSGNIIVESIGDNLNVAVPAVSSSVSKLVLTISGITILNKPVDGYTNATISGYPILNGVIETDEATLSFLTDNATANFVDPIIGTGKAVIIAGYILAGSSSVNYELLQPTGLTADITSLMGSDIILNNTSTTNESSDFDYKLYQGTQLSSTTSGITGSLGVMGFYLRDGGEDPDADNLPTELTSLSFQVINPHLIRAARLFVGSSPRGDVVLVNGQSTINFTGLSGIVAPDNGQLAINLRVTFNSAVTDNEQFIFMINGATSSAAGSMFAAPDAGGTTSVNDGNINMITVNGATMQFVQQPPAQVSVGVIMTPSPTLLIQDQNGNIDLDINDDIFIAFSSNHTITYLPSLFTDGVYAFNDVMHTATGTNFHLIAKAPSLSNVHSTNYVVILPEAPDLPLFAPFDPICEGAPGNLPSTSLNGISGTWAPTFNNLVTTSYTFTPNPGQNSAGMTATIVVFPSGIPTFTPVAPINVGNTLTALPTISNNGISGTWSPALNNTQTTTYAFTPNIGLCSTSVSLTITVYGNSVIVPVFAPVAPVCVDTSINELPTTSINGVVGTWSPTLNNTATTTYTFTPNAGQNAVNTILTIVVNPLTEPSFSAVPAVAYGITINPNVLPTTSANGISGTWSPSLNNITTTTYVFTPNGGFCAASTSLTIEVQQPITTTVSPLEYITTTNPDGSTTTVDAPICLTDTKGELSVSAAGTPIYRVPIALPPGIKDVAPQLALEYSGSSVQGVAGMGWNLNGISSIMRVSSRLDLDGVIDAVDFDGLDRYSLDGQRLLAISGIYGMSGTNYQTEIYSNIKVEPVGPFGTIIGTSQYGPQSFVVTFPDGSQAFYGGTGDSRGLTEWKINRWIDPQGNYIDYKYISENYVTRIDKITWGKNINSSTNFNNTIEFAYKPRLRAEYSYIQTIEIASKKILSHITVVSGGQKFRRYTLGHESIASNYQRVKYVLESAGDNSVSNPVYFEYESTPDGLGEFSETSMPGSEINEIDTSGDFDGNGSADFVANNKVFLNPIDNSNWTGIDLVDAARYFPVSIIADGQLNQFHSVLTIDETSVTNNYKIYSYNKNTNQMVLKSTLVSPIVPFQKCTTQNFQCAFGIPEFLWSTFLEGDYNGDGITEMIHVRPIIQRLLPFNGGPGNYVVQGYKSYVINLKDNLITESAGLAVLAEKANFAADFNGDGRTDILSVDKGTSAYTVFEYNMQTNQLAWLFTGTFTEDIMSGSQVKNIVLGDFNGDSKTDVMIPMQDGQSTWVLHLSRGSSFQYNLYNNFELYQPEWNGPQTENRRKVRTYRAADLNKDGKSDFITHEWESWQVGIENRDSRAYFRYKENIGGPHTKPTFTQNQVRQVSSSYPGPITCLVGEFKNPQANFEFTLIQGTKLWKGQYNKDITAEATLIKVKEVKQKVITEISYEPLVASSGLGTVNDVYHSGNSEMYPYTEIISIPSMKVVDKVTVYYDGPGAFKSQLYKYYGLVVHSGGLGVIGFKKIAKSSWFNSANTDKIWSCVQSNPQLLGQKVYEWTYAGDVHTSFTHPPVFTAGINDLGININTHTLNILPNQVKVIVPIKAVKKDYLTGVTNQTEYFYDNYWNVERTLFSNAVGTKEIISTVYDNPTGIGRLYAIGRLTQVNETTLNYGDSYTSEEKFYYHPTHTNLVQQFQRRGHDTDFITEEYEYDVYGNVKQKSTSAQNVSIRTTKDKYDPNGRFVIEKTDHENFISKFEYNKLGQVIKNINPFNVVTITNYNNWGLLAEIITSGASAAPQKTILTYSRDQNANLITTTTNLATNEVNRIFINKLGQTIKSTTKGFGSGTWVSKVVEYDFLGRKTKESEPYVDSNPTSAITAGNKWNYTRYDNLGRLFQQESYNNRLQSIEYEDLTITTTDGPKTTEVTYDANGNKRIVTDNNETLNFDYYASGLLRQTIYGNHSIDYNYDGWGRLTKMNDPSVSQTSYTNTYNNYGELLTATTPSGTTTYTYSPTGRVETKVSSGQNNTSVNSTLSYNANGLLTSETGTSNTKAYTYTNVYNSVGQLISKKEVTPHNFTHVKVFTYDGQGRLLLEQSNSYITNNVNVNNGNIIIEYGYNTYNGILEQYKDVATGAVLWKLNSANEKLLTLTASLGNGIGITNTYDNDYYINSINHSDATNTALNLEYEFVRERGILNWRKNNVAGVLSWNETFSYDNFERLTSWIDPTGTSSNLYESDGRITANSAVGTYNYGGTSRYRRTSADLNVSGDALYLTRTPQLISYNMFRNPISITEETRGSVNFEYSIAGSRSKSIVLAVDGTTINKNKFYSGISQVEISEKPNQILQFITYLAGTPYNAAVALQKDYSVNGSSFVPNPQEFIYLHRDYQGTILAVSGNNGAIKERRIFDPWGNLKKKFIGNTAVADSDLGLVDFELFTNRGYTGHEHFFSVGIIHMNARIYDPVLRSFLSCDALISNPDNSQNYNRYAYALNNPLMYVDYDGNEVTLAVVATVAVIGAIIGATVYVGMAFYTGTFSWGGLAKSIVIGAVSGAASCGVGEVINSLNVSIAAAAPALTQLQIDLMLALPQATMHGITQGFIQGVSGGNGGQSFLTAAVSSVAAGGYGMVGGNFAKSGVGIVLFGTFAGGTTASLTNGNFWEGAIIGMAISWLNHHMHSITFNKEINKYYGKAADKPVSGISQQDIDNAIVNLPTLRRIYAKLFKKYPGLQVSYSDVFGKTDGKTYFDTDTQTVTAISIFRSAGESYRYMAQTILHEFGHAMSGYHGFFFKNVRKYGSLSDIPEAIDEIYAHKFANYHGGVDYNTPYYQSRVNWLKNTSSKINAESIVLPSFN